MVTAARASTALKEIIASRLAVETPLLTIGQKVDVMIMKFLLETLATSARVRAI